MIIKLKQTGGGSKDVFQYESDFIPMIGDLYASIDIPDGEARKVIERQIIPNVPNVIILYVDYAYPSLVSPIKTSDLEGDLLGTKFVS